MPSDRPRLVIKYGGSTISGADDIAKITKYLSEISHHYKLVVVCSAMGETTNHLLKLSSSMETGERQEIIKILHDIIDYHRTTSDNLKDTIITDHTISQNLDESLNQTFDELQVLVDGLILLSEETPRSRDYLVSFGERFSTLLMASALQSVGVDTVPLSGKEAGILTDSRFGKSKPLMDTTKLRVSKNLNEYIDKGVVPVLGGYAAADQHGRITTFGRGGSDYTATIIAACIDADQVWFMGEMDGMMTADPYIVPEAQTLQKISYSEAREMSMFGEREMHPRTFEPVLDRGIPLRIRSATNTKNPGTLIVPSHMVDNTTKCVSMIRDSGLIDMQGFGMAASPGTAAAIFSTLAAPGISVMMISQNPSESSISIVLKNQDLHKAVNVLEMEHLGKKIKNLNVTTNVAVVSLIGLGLRGTVGTASRVFNTVSNKDVNVIMITQGSSEINLSFVIKNSDVKTVVQALHAEFRLTDL